MSKAVAIVSGGLDSTVLAYFLKSAGYDVHMVSFDYGQRHRRELAYADITARKLQVKHDVVDLRGIMRFINGSSLTNPAIPVPDGWYTEESMKITVVPNRNMIMLAIAGGIAVNENAEVVATAVHTGDHFIYPDCRPPFVKHLNDALRAGNEGFGNPALAIYAPFLHDSKAEIVRIGQELKVPFADTWSCYKGAEMHCGKCGTCNERKEAFALANVPDPTRYEYEGPYVPNK